MAFFPDSLFDNWQIIGATLIGSWIALYVLFRPQNNGLPGPRGLPLVGNAHQMPSDRPWLVFSDWKVKYGDIFQMNVLGKRIIVVNSAKIAKDLMDKKSSLYSDRPVLHMAKLCGFDNTIVLLPYGNEWRVQRRLVGHDMSQSMMPRYYNLQEAAARTLIANLIKIPESLESELKLRMGMIIMRVLYGYQVESASDPLLSVAQEVVEKFSMATVSGKWLVEIIPALQYLPSWFPGAGFKKTAEEWYAETVQGIFNPYYWCKANMETGKALVPNLCGRYLQESGTSMSKDIENALIWASGGMFGGGLDTNMSAVLTFFRAMIHHPHVMIKAREEIHRVIGKDRLPCISDRPNLPYIRGIVAEVLRYGPPVPLCVPHSVTENDLYAGYFIPKGSIIFPNIWHMTHDPEVYPDPYVFDPDRFGGQDSEMDRVFDLIFGFGRRICPGLHLALGSLFAVVSTTIATCDVLPGLDEYGKEVMPSTEYGNGTIIMPSPFTLRLKPISSQAASFLADSPTELE